ncbi:hypothetical protein EW145_g5873 [Phellinidium pouzarii]|uniref:Aldos-2-ulose dehydratase/isomerase (AUDH) Cupin domain-containing protein n=1 Tax=Phellinidium pouzarii TaxID=167371 RepID=A0A4S4KYG1_9AGAM|nr:hypothetical protein EW145_g5873 [Phellinidium pouzarii]
MGAGKINYDRFAYIAIAEVNKGSVLSLYTKTRTMPGQAFTEIVWRYTILDDFANIQCGASIIDILCVDLDGDGVDEIIVSVASEGQKAGIYCYVLASTRFVKFKLSNEAAIKLTPGHFVKKDRVDLASVTGTMPGEIAIHYHSFVPSQIRPFIEDSNLIFSVPRFASSVCEVDVIDVAGFVISLVILPPNASFDIASDETEAVKVLHGALGWINSDSELIERARAAGLPGCVTSMLVDSPDGHVRSGNDGAVFVCMKPSRATDDTNLRGLNVLPSYFPCEVCEFEFKWQRDEQQVGGKDAGTKDWFQVCFEDTRKRIASIGSNNNTCADIAYLHFWAAAPGVSSGFSRHSVSSWTIAPASSSKAGQETEQRRTAATTCTIRASLSNSGGDGGLLYCTGRFDWGVATPTSYQLSRARKMVLPAMHEHGPFWRARRAEEIENADGVDLEAVDVEYPWHAWVASRAGRKGKKKWDVWASFDFPTFITQDIDESNHKSCIIY